MHPPRRHRPPDWPQLIRTIEGRGLSQRGIARELKVAPATVNRWRYGDGEPGYSNGAALILLAGGDPPDVPKDPS